MRRIFEVGADPAAAPALLHGIDGLIVAAEGGEGGAFLHESLDFGSDGRDSVIVAGALGRMCNGAQVDMVIWADGTVITHLQLEPYGGGARRARLPPSESIRAYPPNAYGNDED